MERAKVAGAGPFEEVNKQAGAFGLEDCGG